MISTHDSEVCRAYRKYHPECENMTDEAIMRQRGLGYKIKTETKAPKAPKAPRVRPYTGNQFQKLCASIRKDTQADMKDMFQSDEGESWWESACFDIAQGMTTEPFMDKRLEAYLEHSGVAPRYWVEYLAENIHG